MLHRHRGRSHRIKFAIDNPNVFFSSGEDGYCYLYDLRESYNLPINSTTINDQPPRYNCIEYHDEYRLRRSIYTIDVNPLQPNHIAIGGDSYSAKVYDIRFLSSSESLKTPVAEYYPSCLKDEISIYSGISGLQYHRTGKELLVSYNNDGIYRFDLKTHNKFENNNTVVEDDSTDYLQSYHGHRNVETIKQVTYLSSYNSIYDLQNSKNRDYVLSGSDCGHIFIWDSETGVPVKVLIGSLSNPVNCITPHKDFPLIATSGIEKTIKFWYPNGEKGWFGSNIITQYNSVDPMRQDLCLSEKERIQKEEEEYKNKKMIEEEYLSMLLGRGELEHDSSSSDSETISDSEYESKEDNEVDDRTLNHGAENVENHQQNEDNIEPESHEEEGSRRRSHSEMIGENEIEAIVAISEERNIQEFRKKKLRLRNYVLGKYDELYLLDKEALEREGIIDSDSDIYFNQESDEFEEIEDISESSGSEEDSSDLESDSTNTQTENDTESDSDSSDSSEDSSQESENEDNTPPEI